MTRTHIMAIDRTSPLKETQHCCNNVRRNPKKLSNIAIAALILSSTMLQATYVSALTIASPSSYSSTTPMATRRITSLNASNTLSYDNPPSDMSDFQRRMKNLISKPPQEKNRSRPNKNVPSNLRVVDTLEEYKKVIKGSDDKIVVVRFYAPWCKVSSCCVNLLS